MDMDPMIENDGMTRRERQDLAALLRRIEAKAELLAPVEDYAGQG